MADRVYHRGIAISVDRLADRKWRWAVTPSQAVLGLREESGEIEGDQVDAIRAARSAIEAQPGTA